MMAKGYGRLDHQWQPSLEVAFGSFYQSKSITCPLAVRNALAKAPEELGVTS